MNAIVTFQGFTESFRQNTGTEDLYRNVIRGFSNAETTTMHPMPWNIDTAGFAAYCKRSDFKTIAVVAYSWGAGYAAQNFAKALSKHGLSVRLMMLCDPVYRPQWLSRRLGAFPLAFRALIPGSVRIKIPRNVDKVCGVRQEMNLPQGHPLKTLSPRTTIEPLRVLPYTHTTIDHATEWHAMVYARLHSLFREP